MRTMALAAAGAAALAAPSGAQDGPWRLSETVGAPDWLSLGGGFRARYESLSGQPRAGLSINDQLVSFRTTLLAEARAGRFRFGGEIQDARAYLADDDGAAGTREINALEPLQLYVGSTLEDALGEGSSLDVTAGRFTMQLGSRRLVSSDEYRHSTNGYTGVRAAMTLRNGASATLIYVLPQIVMPDDAPSVRDNEAELDRETFDLQLYGGLGRLPVGASGAAIEATYYRLEEQDQPDLATRDRRLHTAGLRVFRDPKAGALDFDVEGFVQAGEVSASAAATAPPQDVSAWFGHVEAGYSWEGGWSPRLSLEVDYVSGDDAEGGAAGDYERFDTLFGSRRLELAPAGIYSAVGRANMIAPGVRLDVVPSPRHEGFVSVKALRLASDTDSFSTSGVRDASGAAGDDAGVQVDSRWRYWLMPDSVRLEVNAAYLAKGDFYESAPNTPSDDDTIYASFNILTTF